jgi:ABC-type multidrug transport system fused ATPase/permease subunit
MLIRTALWLFLLCLPLFIVAKTLLMFAFFIIAALVMKSAIFLMFAAFAIFVFSGLFFVLKQILQAMKQYFSAEQCEQRHILFTKNQKTHRQRLFYFQRLQLDYFKERQCKTLLEQNNQKQLNALSDSIEQQLKRHKTQLSKDLFSQWQGENRRYRLQQNEQALLELHHKIATIAGK